jgi:hypothetical protein
MAVSVAFVIAGAPSASAAKMTYAQAFKLCQERIKRDHPGTDATGPSSEKYVAGGACMKDYGFRLKKDAKF